MRDKEFINLINKQIFKTDNITYNKSELILYDNVDPLNMDFENYNLNILNQLLALNINGNTTIQDIEKLNDKYIYLGYRLVILDDVPQDKDLYGYIVFETDKQWTEYFNIIGSENCLFIHHLNNNKKTIDYSNTYTMIKTVKPIYIYFEKTKEQN